MGNGGSVLMPMVRVLPVSMPLEAIVGMHELALLSAMSLQPSSFKDSQLLEESKPRLFGASWVSAEEKKS